MTKKTGMRVKDVGATINLGNFSSLHITIGEESEYAGLDLSKAQNYLKRIAESVNGTLNLPDNGKKHNNPAAPRGERLIAYGSGENMFYDHDLHTYTDASGNKYSSVTQLVSKFYEFNAGGAIAQEYMDFAAAYGNLIHTAVQNTLVGRQPKKSIVKDITDSVVSAMGDCNNAVVEQMVAMPEYQIAGRFDILTDNPDGSKTLWDVKTNSDLFAKVACTLPAGIKESLGQKWGTDTLFGEHCLQLNIYAHILEKHCGVKVSKIKIIYIPDGFSKIVEVPKADVGAVLDLYRGGQ